jgi:hypothetical protein
MGWLTCRNPASHLQSPDARRLHTGSIGHSVSRIKLTPSRLVNLSSMIHRNRALVGYIWFCLELDNYDCTKCAPTGEYDLVEEQLDEAAIKSHGDAIHDLMLSSEVIRPISLQQIQIEQKALEGVKTV